MCITFMEGLLHAQIYEIGVLLNRNSSVCCHSYGIFEPNSQLPGWAASTAAVTITALSSQENSLSDFNGDDKQTTLALSTKFLSAHRVEKAWARMAMKRWKRAHMNAWHIN